MRDRKIRANASRTRPEIIVDAMYPHSDGSGYTEKTLRLSVTEAHALVTSLLDGLEKIAKRSVEGGGK